MANLVKYDALQLFSLTPQEAQLFDVLLGCVHHNKINTNLRVAGGWVRDKLLGRVSADIDIAVDDRTGEQFALMVNEYLRLMGADTHKIAVIKENPEQSKHLATATVKLCGLDIDMVNLRSEEYTDSRIPKIRVGTPEEDALRRDFTLNALFYNLNTKEIEDYSGLGIPDLKEGLIRTPLPPIVTFNDDPLRILRAIRFACRYGFNLDLAIFEAVKYRDEATMRIPIKDALFTKVSRDRIKQECDGMFIGLGDSIIVNSKDNCRIRSRRSNVSLPTSFQMYRPVKAILLMSSLNILDVVFVGVEDMSKLSLGISEKCASSASVVGNDPELLKTIVDTTLESWQHMSVATVGWLNVLLSLDDMLLHSLTHSNRSDSKSVFDDIILQLCPYELTGDSLFAPKGMRGDERYLFFAACCCHLRNIAVKPPKKKEQKLYYYLLHLQLRMDNETIQAVELLTESLDKIAQYSRDGVSRDEMAMFVRNVKGLWSGAILLACAVELAQEYHEISFESSALILNERMMAIIQRYLLLQHLGDSYDLEDAWFVKPILDGTEIKNAFNLSGPAIGAMAELQLRWQFTIPRLSTYRSQANFDEFLQQVRSDGTVAQCLEYLRQSQGKL